VGAGFKLFRQQLKFFFSVFFLPSLVVNFGFVGIRWAILLLIDGDHWRQMGSSLPGFSPVSIVLSIILLLGVQVYAQWLFAVRNVAVVRMMIYAPLSYSEAMEFTLKRKMTLSLVYFVAVCLPSFVLIFWVIFDVLIGLNWPANFAGTLMAKFCLMLNGTALLFTLAAALLWCSLLLCVLACEPLSFWGIVKRSFHLLIASIWRGTGFMFLLIVCVIVFQLSCQLPILILNAVDMFSKGVLNSSSFLSALNHRSLWAEILICFLNSLSGTAICSIGCAAHSLYYHDLRQRIEGADMLAKIAQMIALNTQSESVPNRV
jgi:hypothetical protein